MASAVRGKRKRTCSEHRQKLRALIRAWRNLLPEDKFPECWQDNLMTALMMLQEASDG